MRTTHACDIQEVFVLARSVKIIIIIIIVIASIIQYNII